MEGIVNCEQIPQQTKIWANNFPEIKTSLEGTSRFNVKIKQNAGSSFCPHIYFRVGQL
jgi:hypothetical protein